MKSILVLVAVVDLVLAVGAFVTDNAIVAATLVGSAIVAGAGYAIIDRLEQIRDAVRSSVAGADKPPAAAPVEAPPLQEFDVAKAVEAMEAARGRR